MFSFMFLSSQATFPKSYCGGSDFCRSVGPSGCCGLLDNILHPEFGCWSYKAGSVAAEGHLCHRHVWIDSQRHWILCRNHSDKTSGPGLCLFPVRNRYNICKARWAPRGQNQDAGETTKRDGEKQNGLTGILLSDQKKLIFFFSLLQL